MCYPWNPARFRPPMGPLTMRSLRTSLILAVVLPLATATVAGGMWALAEMEERAVERMEEDVQLVARSLQLPLSRALERDRAGSAANALESAFRIGRVYGAYLYDEEGELRTAVGAGAPSEDPDRLSDLAEEGTRVGEYGRAGPEEVYSYFVSLTSSGGRPLGLLQVTRRRSDIDEYVHVLRLGMGTALLVGLLVMTGLVLVGHHGAVGRHLERLLGTMARVTEGDRDHRAESDGPREIARLAEGLNRMLDSINRAEAEVRESREEQLRLERELRQSEKMAAVGRLGAGVAHELGTPLSVLDGRAQRLLRRDDLDPDAVTEVRALREEAARMQEIVRQLLSFGRGVHGSRRSVPADRLVRSVVAAFRKSSEELAGELSADGPTPAPVLEVDPGAMEQVLTNLVRNALQAAEGGRVELRWFGGADRATGGFEVHDDGPGVEPEVRDRLFEPFVTTRETGGTGLGLAVVHGIVEQHGGRVEVIPGQLGGAGFRVVLPLAGSEERSGVGEGTSRTADGAASTESKQVPS